MITSFQCLFKSGSKNGHINKDMSGAEIMSVRDDNSFECNPSEPSDLLSFKELCN